MVVIMIFGKAVLEFQRIFLRGEICEKVPFLYRRRKAGISKGDEGNCCQNVVSMIDPNRYAHRLYFYLVSFLFNSGLQMLGSMSRLCAFQLVCRETRTPLDPIRFFY